MNFKIAKRFLSEGRLKMNIKRAQHERKLFYTESSGAITH